MTDQSDFYATSSHMSWYANLSHNNLALLTLFTYQQTYTVQHIIFVTCFSTMHINVKTASRLQTLSGIEMKAMNYLTILTVRLKSLGIFYIIQLKYGYEGFSKFWVPVSPGLFHEAQLREINLCDLNKLETRSPGNPPNPI